MAKYRPKGPRGFSGFDPMALLQEVQRKMEEMEKALAEQTFAGSAGGGAVKVVLNGQYEVQSVHIAPELLEEGDVEMLQDLLASAFNNAVAEVRKASEKNMEEIQNLLGPLAGLLGM